MMDGSASQDSAQPAQARPAVGWGAGLFVWGVFAVVLLITVAYLVRYSRNLPIWDDFALVPYMLGTDPVTPGWLWEQHDVHRIPLPRIVFLSLLKLSGGDFRSAMAFNLLVLVALTVAMIRMARRLRGATSFTDAFFPLALLHPGHCENLLWGMQIVYLIVIALAGTWLLVILRGNKPGGSESVWLTGVCLLGLPLCGGTGLVLAPLLALWLGCIAWQRFTMEPGRALAPAGFALAGLVLIGLYFVGYARPLYHRSGTVTEYLEAAAQFLTGSFGPAAAAFRPLSGLAVAALLALTIALAALAWFRQPVERLRAIGLVLFLAAVAGLALTVGVGRGAGGPLAGFAFRYVTLAALGACAVFFAWITYGPSRVRPLAQMSLFTLMASMYSLNFQEGLNYGKPRHDRMLEFERDLRAGEPVYVLGQRYTPFLLPLPEQLAASLRMLRSAGVPLFRDLKEDPPFQEIPLDERPAETAGITWEGDTAHGNGRDAHLTYVLPTARYVAGIRITYVHSNAAGSTPSLQVFWKRPDHARFPREANFESGFVGTGPEEQTVTIWIASTIDRIRIVPDNQPFTWRIQTLVLLVPEE
jgi:hypothetical protein